MNSKTERILIAIKEALGIHQEYFDITEGDVLENDEQLFSMTVGIKPKEIDIPDGKITGIQQYLEFNINDDGEMSLIISEFHEVNISAGNIYAALYWGEATKAI